MEKSVVEFIVNYRVPNDIYYKVDDISPRIIGLHNPETEINYLIFDLYHILGAVKFHTGKEVTEEIKYKYLYILIQVLYNINKNFTSLIQCQTDGKSIIYLRYLSSDFHKICESMKHFEVEYDPSKFYKKEVDKILSNKFIDHGRMNDLRKIIPKTYPITKYVEYKVYPDHIRFIQSGQVGCLGLKKSCEKPAKLLTFMDPEFSCYDDTVGGAILIEIDKFIKDLEEFKSENIKDNSIILASEFDHSKYIFNGETSELFELIAKIIPLATFDEFELSE